MEVEEEHEAPEREDEEEHEAPAREEIDLKQVCTPLAYRCQYLPISCDAFLTCPVSSSHK